MILDGLAILGGIQSIVGWAAGFAHLGNRNSDGIPVWAPLGASAVLVLLAGLSWSRPFASRLLAAYWACAAACFAKAGLEAAGLAGLSFELPVAVLAGVLILFARRPLAAAAVQVACIGGGLALMAAAVVLHFPPTPGIDAAVYPAVLLLAVPSAVIGITLNRRRGL